MSSSNDMAPLSMVCRTCQEMLYHHTGRRGVRTTLQIQFDHHETKESLERCAQGSACYICRVIWQRLQIDPSHRIPPHERLGSETPYLTATLKLVPHRLSTFRLDFRVRGTCVTHAKIPTASFILVRRDESSEDETIARPSSSSTSSPEVFALAQRWIKDCEDNHQLCQRSSTSFYPTRLIEIASVSGEYDLEDPVRLVSNKQSERTTKDPVFEGKYVTLSHRWGGTSFLKLQRDNLTQFQHTIHLSDVPLTFQHAIIFARQLKIRWIWIDALCIIQDNEDDWLHESATMDKVYAHSYCNISATAANNSSEGLFRSRDPNHNWVQTVTVKLKDIMDVGETRFTCTVLDLSFWESSVEQAPVNQRSWVLQERLLAPRVLHWCRDQIAFECRYADRAECRPAGVPHLLMMRGELVEGARLKRIEKTAGKDLRKLRLRREYSSPSQERLTQMVEQIKPRWHYYEIWKRVVETYTKMELTKPEDRLIALSGVARMMKEQMESENIKDEYIAGLWQRGLASQLLWYVNEADGHDPQPFDDNRPKGKDGSTLLFRAPTFSWASVETTRGITFAEITKEGLKISIEVVRLRYLTEDRFGILTDGYIVLRGILRRILLVDNLVGQDLANASQTTLQRSKGETSTTPHVASRPEVVPSGTGIVLGLRLLIIRLLFMCKWLPGQLITWNIFTTLSSPLRGTMALPQRMINEGSIAQEDTRTRNRWSWSLLRDGKPDSREYSVVYLDSPASEPSVFGADAQVFVIPALLTQRSLICLMVQATDGDYGIRYKRIGLTIISAVHEQEVQRILTPPTNNEIHKAKYYWGPEGRKSGESVICII